MKEFNYFHGLSYQFVIILMTGLLVLSTSTYAEKKKVRGIRYYKNMFGHIHRNSSKESASLTTVACGHPLRVIGNRADWMMVKIDDQKGHVLQNWLLDRKPDCFQNKYPKFFNALNLELSELYYWGRLYDHYISGRSEIQ